MRTLGGLPLQQSIEMVFSSVSPSSQKGFTTKKASRRTICLSVIIGNYHSLNVPGNPSLDEGAINLPSTTFIYTSSTNSSEHKQQRQLICQTPTIYCSPAHCPWHSTVTDGKLIANINNSKCHLVFSFYPLKGRRQKCFFLQKYSVKFRWPLFLALKTRLFWPNKQTNQPNDDGDDDVFVNLPNTLGAFCYFFTLRPNQVLWLKSS